MVKRPLTWALAFTALASVLWYLARPKPVPVILHPVGRGTVEATVANTRVGTVKACRRSQLAPAAGGRLATLSVREGSRVETGEVLLEVWNDDLKAQWQLEAEEVGVAKAKAEEACLLARLAEREAARMQTIRQRSQLVSEESVDNAVSQSHAKQAACVAAQASVPVQEARRDAALALLEKSRVRAPFAGVVAEINGELGEYVTPTPLGIPTLPPIDLLDVSCLYVSAPIDEVDAPAVQVGQVARVSLDAFRETKFPAKVRRIAPYVLDKEKQARTVEVEVELDDPAALPGLLPGYSADVEILLQSKSAVLRVPSRAVLEGGKVLLYRHGVLEEKRFRAGLADWDYTEVLDGLAEGDLIVLSLGGDGVKPGARAVPEPSAP